MSGRQVIGRSTPSAAYGFPDAGVVAMATAITDTPMGTEVGVIRTAGAVRLGGAPGTASAGFKQCQ